MDYSRLRRSSAIQFASPVALRDFGGVIWAPPTSHPTRSPATAWRHDDYDHDLRNAKATKGVASTDTCRDTNDVALLDLLPWYNCDMTPAITDQMRQALDAEHGQPVKIVDERTSQVYYVISAAQFETMRALFAEGEFEPREAYPLIAKTAAEAGWADPVIDAYDNYC